MDDGLKENIQRIKVLTLIGSRLHLTAIDNFYS